MNRRSFIHRSAALAGGFASFISPSVHAGWSESTKVPDLGSFGLEGTLPKTAGKVVYLDFWASWCAPCKASFPVLAGWHKDFVSRGFLVLGVSVDEETAAMNSFLSKNRVGFPVMHDASHKLVAAANVKTMPTSFLIDRKGVVRRVHNGFHEKDRAPLEAEIVSLLAE